MKVRLLNHNAGTCFEGPEGERVLVYSFDFRDGPVTGEIVTIEKAVPRAHSPKFYSIKFDPPHFGVMTLLGTQFMEAIKE